MLFPEDKPLQIPVTPECYGAIASQHSSSANKYLVVADGSHLPVAMSMLLGDSFSGAGDYFVTLFMVGAVRAVFTPLSTYSCIRPNDLRIVPNLSEEPSSTSSKAVRVRACPDTVVTVAGCTMMVGEEHHLSLRDAIEDLSSKRQTITAMHYGPVNFLLAYAAGASQFQWQWMSADGTQVCQIYKYATLYLLY